MENFSNAAKAANETALPFAPSITNLVSSAVISAAPQSLLAKAIEGDTASLIGLGRAIAQQEGYLIQNAIAEILATSKDLVTLSNVRLPVLEAALDLVAMNRSGTYAEIALDSEAKSRKSYAADIVLVDKVKRHAWIIDVKRSLAGYDSKLPDLITRMQAAGLALSDFLWREHYRLSVESVSVGVVDASSERHRPEVGVWALTELDQLFEFSGFAQQCRRVVEAYREAVQSAWLAQRRQSRTSGDEDEGKLVRPVTHQIPQQRLQPPQGGEAPGIVRQLNAIQIGLARPRPGPASSR